MISVLMSVYNEKEEWLRQAVESILVQTISDFEFIIVVDNPQLSDELRSLLEKYAQMDARIKIINNSANLGLARSLNRALEEAQGEYVARMDADDISFPERFEKEMAFLVEKNADMVACQRINIGEEGEEISRSRYNGRDPNRALPYSNYIVHPSVLMKTSVLRGLNGYRNFKNSEDFDLWLRMISNGFTIAVMEDYLIYYRIRNDGMSQKKPLEQYYISEYQKLLYRERLKNGYDDFSEEKLARYLESKRITPRRAHNYGIAREALNEAITMYRERKLEFPLKVVKALVYYPEIVFKTVGEIAPLSRTKV